MKKQTASPKRNASRSQQSFRSKAPIHSGGYEELEKIVKGNGVTWDLWPEYHIDRNETPVQIGFEFSLIASHPHSEGIPEPGCPECIRIYEDLKRVADCIAPKERRKGTYDIVVADAYPYYCSQRRFGAEVLLTIRVISREGLEGSVDPGEAACLSEMKQKAEDLGIPKHMGFVHNQMTFE